jgi:hypothetical protein
MPEHTPEASLAMTPTHIDPYSSDRHRHRAARAAGSRSIIDLLRGLATVMPLSGPCPLDTPRRVAANDHLPTGALDDTQPATTAGAQR